LTHTQALRLQLPSFMWEPAHISIPGNQRMDKLAKQVSKREHVDIDIELSKSVGKENCVGKN